MGSTQRISAAYSLMSALMSRQALIRLLPSENQHFAGNPDE